MKKTGILVCVLSVLAFNAAAETEITIYNQNLALIKKNQILQLKEGVNDIVFDEVAEQMRPESAFIYGNGIRVLEQNYDYAGINYSTLLNANIGKTVKTVRQNPQTGGNIFEKAVLVAADGISPVLKFDWGIDTQYPGRVLFDEVPPVLNSTPVLMAKVETKETGAKDLNLAYLTSGFSWEANYIAKIDDDETLSLLGRAAVSNNSGSGYEKVKVNLIAGDVNVVRNYMQPRMAKATQGVMLYAANAVSFEDKAVMDAPISMDSYYIYEIPEKTELKNGQIKQVSFITAPKVKYQKEGVLYSSLYFGTDRTSYKDVHPQVVYHFMNNKEDGLGMPLPQGKLSFYASDDKGALQFIGENMMDNKAEGQKVSAQLGRFFDVYGEGQILSVKKIEEKQLAKRQNKCPVMASTYRYTVTYKTTNKGSKVVHMILKQSMPANARILQESFKGQNGEGNLYEWKFDLNSGESKEINLEVENVIEKADCNLINL